MLALIPLGLLLLASPSWAQRPTSAVHLDQTAQTVESLGLKDDQVQALMNLIMRQLPNILDANAETSALARQAGSEAERILSRAQIDALRQLGNMQGVSSSFGNRTREERRDLMKDGLKRLQHANTAEWLKRIDSFDI